MSSPGRPGDGSFLRLVRECGAQPVIGMQKPESNRRKCWVLLGPTASGKGKVAFELALRHPVEIVSVDSMKVYRGMDIGTAKPAVQMRSRVSHHMVDVVEPCENFNVGQYCRMARPIMEEIWGRGRRPLLVGGSALYLKGLIWGLLEGAACASGLRAELVGSAESRDRDFLHRCLAGVDPQAAARIHPNDMKRIIRALEVHDTTGRPISSQQEQFDGDPQLDCVMVALRWPRPLLYERIERRVDRMLEEGLLEEVEGLRHRLGPQSCQALGYRELLQHIEGKIRLDEAVALTKRNTRRFAKHQMTWFRHFPGVEWVEASRCDGDAEMAETCEHVFLEKS